ncbi:MFS transporter [Streptomyces cinnamoneus]|uniref:MFS transporter n=1 Tax=Streptomyces cinnamoneus TaxID=53446 RepID=A0A2G1XN61_STRCJ|nr:MFS transporter [Streptomyces cinnamoneus]PHQ52668.1 MFS transporter [Streptomyces cinnamoneus]PPT12102.1 MFS transporter [Streptomyces cinnamoneus]
MTDDSQPSRRRGGTVAGGLLRRHHDFRLLWAGETARAFGASVTGLVLPLVAVSTLHADTFLVSLINAATWVPWLVIGLPAGAWVDRIRRRPVMLASDAVCCVLFASIPLAAWAGWLSTAQLMVVALLTGTAAVFFHTAYVAYLPTLLAPEDQAEGNAKLHGSDSAAGLVGIGSGGLVAQLFGVANGLLANTTTFLVSFVCVARIRHREPPPEPVERARGALAREIGEGLRMVASDPYLRSFTLFGATANLVLTAYQSIAVVFLFQDVGVSSGMIGVMGTIGGLGSVLGALVVRRTADRLGSGRALLLFEMGLLLFAPLMAFTSPGPGLLLYVAGSAAVGTGVVAGNIIKAGFLQRYCPSHALGRISASSAFLNFGAMPLGALLGGALGTAIGLRPAFLALTLLLPLSTLILFFSPVRAQRELPERALQTA